MLFKVETGKDVFVLNPELKAIPEFVALTPKQMMFIILSVDYKSPLRKMATNDRKRNAAMMAGYKIDSSGYPDKTMRAMMNNTVQAVAVAIKKYNELQRDEDYETLLSVSKLIADIRDFNAKKDKTPSEIEKAVAITTGKLDKLIETKKKIEQLIDMREDASVVGMEEQEGIVSEGELSLLDQLNLTKQ